MSAQPEPGRSRPPLPERAAETSAERPWPVRLLTTKISEYVQRMPPAWVEGQVVQLSVRPGSRTAYLTLRDPDVDMSLSVVVGVPVLQALGAPLQDGARVVVRAKPVLLERRGTLHLQAAEVRPVGVGELLARLEQLKRVLAAEGLFDADRKRPLPFLPRVVGLVTGRASAAERDVVEVARRRWPAVRFEVREVAVQGPSAVAAVVTALQELDRAPEVDVVVVARGGGSTEDLLPFSNEALLRAVAACLTPVVSAIGHEVDAPLLDLVADVRAATPTDAAKRVVPDVAEEAARVDALRTRAAAAVEARLVREEHLVAALRSRPALTAPTALLDARDDEVVALRERARRCTAAALDRSEDGVAHLRERVRALSPAATLARGYAVVQDGEGRVVRDAADVAVDEELRVRLAAGELRARRVAP